MPPLEGFRKTCDCTRGRAGFVERLLRSRLRPPGSYKWRFFEPNRWSSMWTPRVNGDWLLGPSFDACGGGPARIFLGLAGFGAAVGAIAPAAREIADNTRHRRVLGDTQPLPVGDCVRHPLSLPLAACCLSPARSKNLFLLAVAEISLVDSHFRFQSIPMKVV